VPVYLTRADGERKILSFIATEFTAVIEGGIGNEREVSLPAEDSYYLSGGGSTGASHPFKIRIIGNEDDGYAIRVNAGTLNNVLAGNWEDEFPTSESDGNIFVFLTASCAGNKVVSTELNFATNAPQGEATPVKWATPSSFDVLLGLVNGTTVTQVVFDNLGYNAVKRLTTDKQNPSSGELPYDNWYTWGLIS
jgi:hypothetical protein